jgi:hypothetical protein
MKARSKVDQRVTEVPAKKGREHMKGFRRLHRVMGLSLVTAALVLLWAVPGTAGAAVQLGQISQSNPLPCNPNINGVQRTAPAPLTYQVPVPGGVITSWSHRGITPAPAGSGRLQIWDLVSGNDFILKGRSELETFSVGLVTTFLTRIPVDPGDMLGIRTVEDGTGCGLFITGTINFEDNEPDPNTGDVRTLPPFSPWRWNIAAVLEPDADNDGFGDETQDACLGEAGQEDGCLTPPPEPPQPEPPPPEEPPEGGGPPPEALTLDLRAKKQELRKKIKFFATASSDSTLTAKGKKIKETTKQLAANQKTKVKAKLKRKARNRLEEKLDEKGKAKVKVKGTASDPTGTATDTVKVKLKD